MMVNDNPRTTLTCEIGPDPLDKNTHPQAALGQEFEMDGRPGHPSQKPADRYLARLQNGKPFADDGHIPLVEVTKWSQGRMAGHLAEDEFSGVLALLYCNLRNPGQRVAALIE